ncbi:hypothetical protein LWI29_006871 [Acer saccharum]|uniref:non-specific serine/threonine protein kinase n=1 Tax=Acer saccharum TaxID=4024 RepID=A0AA39W0Y7_ACESA|nr:hypothetical protein LWI29_006871 [Acer saccharum]
MDDSRLYTEARLSPISLTYYGFCMGNGKYSVNLHFAEIMFTDDKTYNSSGRRIFDIYVQGKLVLKDFNIEDEAGGAAKAIVKKFTVAVTNNTLEIRLYWAGKGTVSIPVKGVYGPLISAISVTPNLKGLGLHTGSFTLRQIKAATNSFNPENKIGEGGFGPVYKGRLADDSVIAVKQLSSKSKQGNREFVNEIGMISALQHPHLVKLYGCCIEGNQLLLVYEYLENNSLARALFGPKEHQLNLDWPTRHKICVGIARGLAYLHEESRLKIVHRDIKATNVLLDKDLNPKISDFGLAKLDEEDNTHISTRVAGTFGYMAPEYAMRGYLTDKADVYSFGIVALEIVSGRSNTTYRQKEDAFYLLDWALVLKDEGKLMELVDPKLGSSFNEKEVMVMINVALLCSDVSPTVRPLMSTVVSMLEGRAAVQDFVPDSVVSADEETKSEAIRKYYQFNEEEAMNKNQNQSQSQSLSISMDEPRTTSAGNDPKKLVITYGGKWVGNFYESGETEFLKVQKNLTYDELLRVVQGVANVDLRRFTIELRTLVDTDVRLRPARPKIKNDSDVEMLLCDDQHVPEVYISVVEKVSAEPGHVGVPTVQPIYQTFLQQLAAQCLSAGGSNNVWGSIPTTDPNNNVWGSVAKMD